jgi:spermidine synthase
MPLALIYIIACLEGFTTLAIQMIILRLAIPITGSSIVVTSIFLWVILLALSCGYWWGGIIAEKYKVESIKSRSLTSILWRYLIVSGIWYLVVVIPFQRDILQWMMTQLPYEAALFMVALLLFFVPIFLASQTIPILTELIPIESKGRSAGLIFFVSTIGSFLGSIVTTLLLFPFFGVFKTGVFVSVMLIVLGLLSIKSKVDSDFLGASSIKSYMWILAMIIWVWWYIFYFMISASSPSVLASYDSAYQEIIVKNYNREGKLVRIFHTNRAFASGFDPVSKQSPFDYIRHMVDQTKILQPKRVLVIGAAGFVYPYEISKFDFVEQVDAIDIDPKVKDLAEQYLLQETLSPKVHFIPESARYAVRRLAQEGKQYDLIIVDAFLGKSVPSELVTQEFMQDLLKLSSNKQILWNMILDNDFHSNFSQRFLKTAQTVFGQVWTYDVMWQEKRPVWTTSNIIVASAVGKDYRSFVDTKNSTVIYHDDRNSAEIDSVVVLKD